MNLRLQNQLNMVGACLSVAQSPAHKPVWEGRPPADFGPDLAELQADHAAILAKAAQAEAATGGAADAKAAAESALEDAAFVLARALAYHFKKTGDLDRLGKVDLTRSGIMKLRTQDLVNRATAIRDLAGEVVSSPDAGKRGITAARVTTLTAAIEVFSRLMNTPRGQIVNRGALLKELETDVASLLESARNLDDLVVQFDDSESGRRFIEAWRRARIIVDSGGGGAAPTPVTPSPAPAS
ncbi:MAG: hypothetical protein ACKVYV_02520 [Limisphaerales bacterium]